MDFATEHPIVMIVNSFVTGGAERLVIDTANELWRRGVPVRVITLRPEKPDGSLAPELLLPESHWRRIHFRSFLSIPAWAALIRTLREWRPAAVLTYLWFSNSIGRIAAPIAGAGPVISFELNVYDYLKSAAQFFADRILSRISSKIIASSEAVSASLAAHGIRPEKIEVLLNAMNIAPYRRGDGAELRQEIGIAEDAFVFLFVGRLVRQKGLDVLLEAHSRVRDGVLVVAGSGEEESALKSQARRLGIDERVRFLGTRHDIPKLLFMADGFVLPSRWEGLPMVLIAALAAGKPIVASDIASVREIVTDREQGILFPSENHAALAAALAEIMADRDLGARLSANAKALAKDFSIERYVEKLLALIHAL